MGSHPRLPPDALRIVVLLGHDVFGVELLERFRGLSLDDQVAQLTVQLEVFIADLLPKLNLKSGASAPRARDACIARSLLAEYASEKVLSEHAVAESTGGGMRWIQRGALVTAGALALSFLFGLSRPESHVASTRARYATAPDVLWETLADVERWPEWNPEVHAVEWLPDRGGHPMVNVVGSWGSAPTEVTAFEPPRRLRTEMDAGDFSGSWTYELSPAPDGGTLLTVTEEGHVASPFIRALMVFHDNYATMMEFHRALGARLGEVVVAERVEPATAESGTP